MSGPLMELMTPVSVRSYSPTCAEISDAAVTPAVEEEERIDVEVRPLADLDDLIAEARDSKTLIGLLKLRARLG